MGAKHIIGNFEGFFEGEIAPLRGGRERRKYPPPPPPLSTMLSTNWLKTM
jgi:hypothetical protein